MISTNLGVIFCTKCGKENEATSTFCSNCGNPLKKLGVDENNYKSINFGNFNINNDFSEEEMIMFLSTHESFYLEKFNQINSTGDKKTWNWSAFLATIYWLLYRKMYAQGAIYFVANLLFSCIPLVGWVINLGLWIGIGIFANSLYLDHINKKFQEINCSNSSSRQILINKKGGTTIVIPLLFFLIPVVIVTMYLLMHLFIISSMSYYY